MRTKIKLVRNTLPLKIKVTGAALRSVELADKAADQFYAELQMSVDAVNDANGVVEINATNIAEMFRAIQGLNKIRDGKELLVKRHQHYILANFWESTYGNNIINENASHQDYAKKCAEWYKGQLVEAGVPMSDTGFWTREYWLDAAARGC